jgi:diacylglycerol kinase (ATP)
MSIGAETLRFREPGIECKIHIHDIREGKTGQKPGFLLLNEQIQKRKYITSSNPIRVLVAGGDGTVMWSMQESIAHHLDLSKLAFGVIPYGTGNDFARTLLWGGSAPTGALFNDGMKGFKVLLRRWLSAEVRNFDLWDIQVTVSDDGGQIRQIKNKQKVVMKDGSQLIDHKLTTLTKPMCNYFSIGIESRVGLGFDKKRTKSQLLNKTVYVWEGIKKIFTTTPKITDIVASVSVGDKGVILSTSKSTDGVPTIRGRPVSLIFMNIASFAGGCDLWKGAKKPGLSNMDITSDVFKSPQDPGDGKLEILTYQSLPGLSMEQAKGTFMAGNGCRISQERGPIDVKFKDDLGTKRTYMQIDGEFFTLDKPLSVRVSPKLTVKVLVNTTIQAK